MPRTCWRVFFRREEPERFVLADAAMALAAAFASAFAGALTITGQESMRASYRFDSLYKSMICDARRVANASKR